MFIVHLKDGRTLKESDGVDWKQVKGEDISSLQLYRNGKFYTVAVKASEDVKLLQLKRGIVGTLLNVEVSERVVGFIYKDSIAVKMEVDEESSNVRLTLEVRDGKKWRKL